MTEITVPFNDRYVRYLANAGQTVFAYDFPILDAADLEVRRWRADAVAVLVRDVDYTVSGAGDQAGGEITLVEAAQAGDRIAINGARRVERITDFTQAGAFTTDAINAEFDRFAVMLQELRDRFARVPSIDPTDTPGVDLVLPSVTRRASRWLGFDGSGNAVVFEAPDQLGLQLRDYWLVNASPDYALRDVVSHNGKLYICKAAHRPATVDAEPGVGGAWQTYWTLAVDRAFNAAGNWAELDAYEPGQFVQHLGQTFYCTVGHIATGDTEPINGGLYTTVWQTLLGAATVLSVYGRTGAVTAQTDDYAASQVANDSANVAGVQVSDALDALKALVDSLDALKAPLASPVLTGTPQAPNAVAGTATTQIATTAFVQAAIDALINAAPGALDTLEELAAALGDDPNFATTIANAQANLQTQIDSLNTLKAPLASPVLTGAPAAPTAAPGTATTQLATTAFVDAARALLQAAIDLKAPLDSPVLTGTPAAPTAAPGTNTTQLATTAFVEAAVAALIDTAPGALDTLNELAAALGDDPNFAATMNAALAARLLKANNLSDLTDAAAARTNLGLGTAAVQADTHFALSARALTTAATSGLGGGGDLTADRALALDFSGMTQEVNPDPATDLFAFYDASIGAMRACKGEDLPGGGGGGGASIAYEKYVALSQSSATAIPNSTTTDLIWGVEDANVGGWWVSGTPERITVPTGVALVDCRVIARLNASSGANGQVAFRHYNSGGTLLRQYTSGINAVGDQVGVLTAPAIAVTPGDYLTVIVFQNSGASRATQTDQTLISVGALA